MFRTLITKRGIHSVPKLPNITTLINQGIPPILSKQGFDTVWTQNQTYLCDKLTLVTAGTSLESYYPFHIVLNTAKKSFQSHIFNLASAIHNNHLFIENILPGENGTDNNLVKNMPSGVFLERIESSFNGKKWDELKEDIINDIENKLLGQGWFCLVENSNKQFQYLFLQNNGTPYYFPRNQLFDLNSIITIDEFSYMQRIKDLVNQGVKDPKSSKIKDWTLPIIMVNLWDHAYLQDYGVGHRKEYMRNVLDNLNWNVINKRLYN